MTDREAAAGLVERLEKPKWKPFNGMLFLDDNTTTSLMCEAALTITTLLSELERVGKERDTFEAAYEDELCSRVENGIRATKAEALIAEAVRVCEPFATFADISLTAKQRYFLQLLVCPEGDDHPENYGPHFRAARAFIDRAKES